MVDDQSVSELVAVAEDALLRLDEARSEIDALMASDSRGWSTLGSDNTTLPHNTRTLKAKEAVLAAAADPLIKRGLAIRAAYIWADGVQVAVRDEPGAGQDVQAAVVAPFWEDKQNRGFTGITGQLELERELGTSGEVWLALPTTDKGRVRVRQIPFGEVVRVVTDPEDAETDWFYLRERTVRGKSERRLYPALGYRPALMPDTPSAELEDYADDTIFADLRSVPIEWGAPVRKVIVNRLGDRGVGDAFASIPWSDAYGKFLNSWHRLMLSLARFAWRAKTRRTDKVAEIARKITDSAGNGDVGRTAITDPETQLEAIGKSGATFDAGSGKPLLSMVAAGLGLPVTILSTDPGTTGARAVAETLDKPTKLEFGTRRALWAEVFSDVIGWVIDSAVRARKLRGTVDRDGDSEIVTLPDGDGRTVVVTWPSIDDPDTKSLTEAIERAANTQTLPDLVIARLLLEAFGVSDMDEILDQITDDDGNFIPPASLRDAVMDRQVDSGALGYTQGG